MLGDFITALTAINKLDGLKKKAEEARADYEQGSFVGPSQMRLPAQWIPNIEGVIKNQLAAKSNNAEEEFKKSRAKLNDTRSNVPKYNRSDMSVWEPLLAAVVGAFDPTGQFAQSYTQTRRGLMDQRDQIDYQNRMAQYNADLQNAETSANDAYNIYRSADARKRDFIDAMLKSQQIGVDSYNKRLDREARQGETALKAQRDLEIARIRNEPKLQEINSKYGAGKAQGIIEEAKSIAEVMSGGNPALFQQFFTEQLGILSGKAEADVEKQKAATRKKEIDGRLANLDKMAEFRRKLVESTVTTNEAKRRKLLAEADAIERGDNAKGGGKNLDNPQDWRLRINTLTQQNKDYVEELNTLNAGIFTDMTPEQIAARSVIIKQEIAENEKTIRALSDALRKTSVAGKAADKSQKSPPPLPGKLGGSKTSVPPLQPIVEDIIPKSKKK